MTTNNGDENILCISTCQHGGAMLRELARLGCRVTLLTIEASGDADWPREALHEFQTMPGGMTLRQVVNTVTYLARSRKFVRILALDPASVETAAALREHMRVPGMGLTTTRYFDDRLAMRARAGHLGIRVPAFTSTLNDDDVRVFLERVAAPWLLTPRSAAIACTAIDGDTQALNLDEEVWSALERLGDARSDVLLEQMIFGDQFSVNGITADNNVVHAQVFPAARNHREERELKAIHAELIPGLGMVRGASNAKFLRSNASGALYFLQATAQPGEIESASNAPINGCDPWVEWAHVEVAALRGEKYSSVAAQGPAAIP